MSVVDAHVHIWDLGLGVYAWPDESVPSLHRTIGFDEAWSSLADEGVSGAVLVQAADAAADTRHLIAVAAAHPAALGVVGWIPLRQPSEARELLAEFTRHSAFVGVRALLHTYDDPDWILAADDGLALLERAGLSFDYVTGDHRALHHLPELSERHPELSIVVDHLGRPPLGGSSHERAAWRALMAGAAANPLVSAKISGLYPPVGLSESHGYDQIRRYVDAALELFGPRRLMYGSDWPVSTVAGGSRTGLEIVRTVVDELAPEHRDEILGGNAARIYRLQVAGSPRPGRAA